MAQPALSTEIEFDLPPVLLNGQGQMRTVGIEIEFVGPSAETTVQALQEALGGRLIEQDPHAFALKESAVGDLTVELDSRILHPGKQAGTQKGVLPKIAALFGFAARYLVPCELVTAPIPVDRLQEINRILTILRRVGAKGTQDGPFYAFGLHFNPEIPHRDAATLTAFMKSFALLNPWLRREASPDATRNLLGFADPFPTEYVRRIGDPGYWPDIRTFIDDYLGYNATRNRDLDLLPLLHDFDAARVRAVLPNEKINGRPTFHYRLPDARVSDPGWSIAPDWNRWVCVERLAADREKLDAVGAAYLSFEGEDKSWANVVEQIVRS
ncbi:amidoligase family protein [Microvirga mediterraneensis]|uniref:Amidoligase family protein n=1 Tax=Microvirga mediterraneensis TaxID=2754695 RepID=A0A838BI59_9HYPH|nr:amidoligase family protein [Microvirga mediterraneensis]MBA1154921.1 amidoligase family protein [Microvirga mediterraneensis]